MATKKKSKIKSKKELQKIHLTNYLRACDNAVKNNHMSQSEADKLKRECKKDYGVTNSRRNQSTVGEKS